MPMPPQMMPPNGPSMMPDNLADVPQPQPRPTGRIDPRVFAHGFSRLAPDEQTLLDAKLEGDPELVSLLFKAFPEAEQHLRQFMQEVDSGGEEAGPGEMPGQPADDLTASPPTPTPMPPPMAMPPSGPPGPPSPPQIRTAPSPSPMSPGNSPLRRMPMRR